MKPSIINLTPVEIRAAAGKPVKVAGVLYGGGIMHIGGYGNVVLVIAGMEVSNPVTLLADHDNAIGAVAGTVTVNKTATEVRVNGALSNSPAGTAIAGLLADGVRLQMSVGFTPGKTRYVKAGEKVIVNGRELVAPRDGLTVIESGKLREATATPLGADDSTSLSIAASRRRKTSMNFETWCAQNEITTDNISAKALAAIKATYEAHIKPANERIEARAAACAKARADRPMQLDSIEEIEVQAEREDWTGPQTEQALMRGLRADPRIGSPRRSIIANNHDALACAMAHHLRLQLAENTWSAPVMEAADKLRPMIPTILRAVGSGREDMIRAHGFSTSDIPTTLSNIAGKSIDHAFAMFPRTSQSWIGKKTGDDFKTKTDIRPFIKDGRLLEVGAGGELTHVAPSEGTRERQIKTRGKILTVTRQALINDDVGYWAEAIMELGRQGARSHEHDVYAALLANTGNFWHSNNNNYMTGSTTVLSYDSLGAAVKLLRERVDGDNMPIGLIPMVLLVPPALEQVAKQLVNSATLARDQATDNLGTSNPFLGLKVEVEPRLASTAIHANASDTAWYLFADPRQAAALVVSYLDGKETPTIEEVELPAEVLGKGWRIYFDYGCDLYEVRAGVKSKGAA